MKIIIPLLALMLIGAEPASPPPKEEPPAKICSIVDRDSVPESVINKERDKYFELLSSKSGVEYDPDYLVFRSKSGNQLIAFVLGTDNYRAATTIFWKNKMPSDVTMDQYKLKIAAAPVIDDKYFVTKKGIKLGMTYQQVEKIYGKPHSTEASKKEKYRITCSWTVVGKCVSELLPGLLEKTSKDKICNKCEIVSTTYNATIIFVSGKVEQINFNQYYPG